MRYWLICVLEILLALCGVYDAFATKATLAQEDLGICNTSRFSLTLTDGTITTAMASTGTGTRPDCSGNKVLLLIPGTWQIANNLSIPARLKLKIPSGSVVNINSGKILTLAQAPECDEPTKCIVGDGTLTITGPSNKPHASYISSGCDIVVPSASLTLDAFACTATINISSSWLVDINQTTLAVGPLNSGDGTYWVAVHRNTVSTVSSWTRQTNAHYLWQKNASQPSEPSGGIIIAKITVGGGVITAIEARGNSAPGQSGSTGLILLSLTRGATLGARLNNALSQLPSVGGVLDARGLTGAQSIPTTVVLNKIVQLLLGTYTITGPTNGQMFQTWSGSSRYHNTTIEGMGAQLTTLKVHSSCAPTEPIRCTLIELQDPDDLTGANRTNYITIRNLTLDGNKANVAQPGGGSSNDLTHSGVFSNGSKYCLMENLEVRNFWYAGLEFGLYGDFNRFANIVTENNGYSNVVGYGGIFMCGSSNNNVVTNHVSISDIVGIQICDNALYNVVSGTYRNNFHALIMTDQGPNTSVGNMVTASAYNCGSQCLNMSGAGAQRDSDIRMTIDTAGDDGVYIGQGVQNSRFDLQIRRATGAGIKIDQAHDNVFNLVLKENSQGGVLGEYALRCAGCSRNTIRAHIVDNQATNTQRGLIITGGGEFNLIEAFIRGTILDVNDTAGGTNIVRFTGIIGGVLIPGAFPAVSSLSTGGNRGYNLTGSTTIDGANTTNTVTFATAEPNANYNIVMTPMNNTAGMAAGSTRIKSITRLAASFTYEIEVAPGGVQSVTFAWMLIRTN